MTANIIYTGNLRCAATHLQSGTVIETDAPTDNKGKGERYSPTDLVCVALATCIVTTIGIKVADLGISIDDTVVQVTKHMATEPRRIGRIQVRLLFNGAVVDNKTRTILERVAHTCPVHRSLHPDVVMDIELVW